MATSNGLEFGGVVATAGSMIARASSKTARKCVFLKTRNAR